MKLSFTIKDLQKLDFLIQKLSEPQKFKFLLLYNQKLIHCNAFKFSNGLTPTSSLPFDWDWRHVHDRFIRAFPHNICSSNDSQILCDLKKQSAELLRRSSQMLDLIPDSFISDQLPLLYDVAFIGTEHKSQYIFIPEDGLFQVLAIEPEN